MFFLSPSYLNLLSSFWGVLYSIIVTVISIVFSRSSAKAAKEAKQYKKDALLVRDMFDLEGLHSRFQIGSRLFQEKTRSSQWNKGIDPNTIISPYTEVLLSFGRIYHLVKEPETLKERVHSLNKIVNSYDKRNKEQLNDLIIEITDILQQEIVRNRNNIN